MIDIGSRQRSARVYYWVSGILFVLFAALSGYQWWISRDGHRQNDKEVAEAKKADLAEVDGQNLVKDSSGKKKQPEVTGKPPEKATVSVPKPSDWPQWGGLLRDGIYRGEPISTNWPTGGPKKLWEAQGGTGYSALSVAEGKVVTMLQDGDQDAVGCWDADTGKRLWTVGYASHYTDGEGNGPRSTPSIDIDPEEGSRVYAVGARGTMICLKLEDGKEIWRRDLMQDFQARKLKWGISFSPLVMNDRVIALPGGPGGNAIVALDKMTGKTLWKSLDDFPGYSSPIVSDALGKPQLLCFMGEHLVSVNPEDGKEYWRYEWSTSYYCNIATPIVRGEYVFISSDYGKGGTLLRLVKKGDDLGVTMVWENRRMMNHFNGSVFHDNHIYGFSGRTSAYLTCLDLRDGSMKWRTRRVNKGSLIAAEGHLIVLGGRGEVWLAEASPAAWQPKASFQFVDGRCYTPPVVANGKLYLRDESKIACYDVHK